MAARRRLDQRRNDPGAGGLRKRAADKGYWGGGVKSVACSGESSERPRQFRAGMQKLSIAAHWSPIEPFRPPRDGLGES